MRLILNLMILAGIAFGGWWAWNNVPGVQEFVNEKVHGSDFPTLEARFTAEQIMNSQEKQLLRDSQHSYLTPSLQFVPYLLMEVKYSADNSQTHEGIVLWGMDDGEMVISTETWEKTHGFEDCINASTTKEEFRILNLLARQGGSIDRKQLSRELHIEDETLEAWVSSCRKKKLIVQDGNTYRLHFQKPRLVTVPETKINQWLVTKPFHGTNRLPSRYKKSDIERAAQAAFGRDFTIRTTREVYLPIYVIRVQNPDGSVHTSYWNALTSTAMKQFNVN